jgi:hypothetical protein
MPAITSHFSEAHAYKEFGGGSYTYFLDATGAAANNVRVVNVNFNPGPTAGNYTGTFTDLVFNTTEKSHIALGANSALSTGATVYFGNGQSAASDSVLLVMTQAGTLSDLYFQGTGSPGGAQTYTITVNKNGSATALTCTATGASAIASDTTHSVRVAPGDYISIKAVASATAANSGGNYFGLSFVAMG